MTFLHQSLVQECVDYKSGEPGTGTSSSESGTLPWQSADLPCTGRLLTTQRAELHVVIYFKTIFYSMALWIRTRNRIGSGFNQVPGDVSGSVST
jgi:hypothetical protein